MLRASYMFGLLALWPLLGTSSAFAQPNFTSGALPGGEVVIPILYREAIFPPARYRVIFVPGSGCAGLAPIADRYFRGLIHAEVLILHKPGADLMAGPAPKDCASEFVQWDALSRWATAARIALQADTHLHSRLPQILVGASEGAEILPSLTEVVNNLHAIVMISSSGLDPREAGYLQARRIGAEAAWRDLGAMVASTEPDNRVHQGRTLRYWRDLWSWHLTKPLLKSKFPIIQVWGSEDASVPSSAYVQFSELATRLNSSPTLAEHICIYRLEGADHGLQSPDHDGLQWLWSQLERWARVPDGSPCTMARS